jgi:hypothetical protein
MKMKVMAGTILTLFFTMFIMTASVSGTTFGWADEKIRPLIQVDSRYLDHKNNLWLEDNGQLPLFRAVDHRDFFRIEFNEFNKNWRSQLNGNGRDKPSPDIGSSDRRYGHYKPGKANNGAPTPVPEPATAILMAIAMGSLFFVKKIRKNRY